MKKIIYVFIICTLLFSIVQLPQAFAAGNSRTGYILLKDLNIIKDSVTDFGGQLTAEELARMCVMLHTGGNTDENTDFLKTAKDSGLIGESVKEPISLNTAAAALVKSVYWRLCAGMTEQEIIKFGTSHGLLKSISFADSSTLTLAEASEIVENILNMNSMDGTIGEGGTYKLGKKTILEDFFDLTVKDGVLYTGKMQDLPENRVTVGDEIYITDKDYTEYAGFTVRAYVREDKLVSVDTAKFQNEIYVISANDIVGVDAGSITIYRTGSKKVTLKTADDAKEVYNGRLVNFKAADMDISNGFVTLIKHPGSTHYNAVIIRQYDIMVAGGTGNNVIYGLNDTGISIKLDNVNIETTITLEGETVNLSEIKKYDVLLLSYTKQRDALEIEIVRNTVSGTVTEWGSDTVKIGRKTYLQTAYFKKHAKQAEIGSEAELILDKAGLAVDIKAMDGKNRYGYFMGLFKGEIKKGDSYKGYWIRLLNDEGKVENIKLREKLKVNEKSVKNTGSVNDDIESTFKTLIERDETSGRVTERAVNDYVYQIIIYRTDSEGDISYIDTAIREDGKTDEDQLTFDCHMEADRKYKADSAQFVDGIGLLSDVTVIFRVPSTDNDFDASGNLDTAKRAKARKDKHYELASTGYIGNDQTVTADAYDVTKGGLAKAFILYNTDLDSDDTFRDTGMPLFVVTRIVNGVDTEEESCYVLEGYENAKKKIYYIKKDEFGRNEGDVFVEPKVHDIMQIKADSDGNVISYTTRYNGKDNINYYPKVGNEDWRQHGFISGFVYDKDEYGLRSVTNVSTKENERIIMNKGIRNIFLYDMKEKEMTVGSINDLVSYKDSRYKPSRFYASTNYGVVRTLIVYINEEGK